MFLYSICLVLSFLSEHLNFHQKLLCFCSHTEEFRIRPHMTKLWLNGSAWVVFTVLTAFPRVCVSSPGMEINNADRPQCCQPQVSFLSLLFMHPYKNQCHSSYCSYTFVFNLSPSSTYTLMPLTVSTKACSWLWSINFLKRFSNSLLCSDFLYFPHMQFIDAA